MKLTNPDLMRRYMEDRNFSQARLARFAGCSRQFIFQLLNDPKKRSCTDTVGKRIEEALGVLPETLFVSKVSIIERPTVGSQRTKVAA